MSLLEIFDCNDWDHSMSLNDQDRAAKSLEGGKVLYFPHLKFSLLDHELPFLSPKIVSPKTKNVSFDAHNGRLAGAICENRDANSLQAMLGRFAVYANQFLRNLIPHYQTSLQMGKTSFRPVEIKGRASSRHKDDTLLHVDSFPSNPTKGKRILRVFTNINPNGVPRIWRVGEPFEEVVKKMASKVSAPFPGSAHLLKTLGITKDYRTLYDHYMLNIHNKMKEDVHYQESVSQEEIAFPAGSSWIVFTDQVSHAAMSGQHVLEQTFHLPVNGLMDRSTNPLSVLEKYLNKTLVS